jgi:C4-dicarboxylate-specific signal transduction histidine kinase
VKRVPVKEAAFMGKVTAGLTHELKNIFAIIKESAGLMEDLLALSKGGPLTHQERFERSLNRIGEQVARGVNLAVRLNRFAHAPDEAVASVDLGELSDLAAFLSHRRARGMGVTLNAVGGDLPVIIVTDPFRAQMLLFECIDVLINLEGRGTHITIQPAESNNASASLQLVYEENAGAGAASADLVTSSRWPGLLETAQSLPATIEPSKSSLGLIVRFSGEGGPQES